MNVKYSPRRSCGEPIIYEFSEDEIIAHYEVKTDVFDFTGMPDGEMADLETSLSINPVLSAKKEGGVLSVILLYYHGKDATEKERYPVWQVI